MDDLDRRLIAALRDNARAPVATLARALNVSRATVQARIDRMLARGDIAGFTVRTPQAGADGRVRAVMTVAVEGERSTAVIAGLKALPEVRAVHTTNGRWDLVVDLDAESLAAFSLALDAVRLIPGVASTETSILLRTRTF